MVLVFDVSALGPRPATAQSWLGVLHSFHDLAGRNELKKRSAGPASLTPTPVYFLISHFSPLRLRADGVGSSPPRAPFHFHSLDYDHSLITIIMSDFPRSTSTRSVLSSLGY